MQRHSTFFFIVCLITFFSCKKGSDIIEPTSPSYLSKIQFETAAPDTYSDGPYHFEYDSRHQLSAGTFGTLLKGKFSYNSEGKADTLNFVVGELPPYDSYTYFIKYDANQLPVSGIRNHTRAGYGSNSLGSSAIDSIFYIVNNGLITGVRFYNRTIVSQRYDASNKIVNDTTRVKDTLESYSLSYLGSNLIKAHKEDKSKILSPDIVEIECVYGNKLSPFIDSREKFFLTPDRLFVYNDYPFEFISWHTNHELLSYKKTYISQGLPAEEFFFTYTYSTDGYPIVGTVTSGSKSYKKKFVY